MRHFSPQMELRFWRAVRGAQRKYGRAELRFPFTTTIRIGRCSGPTAYSHVLRPNR
jgi:hypothetical protein